MSLGNFYIISAPSGAGKSSLINALLKNADPNQVKLSISHTTRAIRGKEIDGKDYYFVSKEEFQNLIDQDNFLEWATVFGNFYGTSKTFIENSLAQGCDILLDIDWQGARQIREKFSNVKTIYILPPSVQALEMRLMERDQDLDLVRGRMLTAQSEIDHYSEFDYLIVNDDFNTALQELQTILQAERLKQQVQKIRYQRLLQDLLQ